jgi:repressor LexA
MEKLTARQRKILEFITAAIEEKGYAPSFREIGKAMGIKSTNGVSDHLKALEKKGYLKRDGSKSRSIRVTSLFSGVTKEGVRKIPMVKKLLSKEPLLSPDNVNGNMAVDGDLLGGKSEIICYQVGEEKIPYEGVFKGDYLFFDRADKYETGDKLLVIERNKINLRAYAPEDDGSIRLEAVDKKGKSVTIKEGGRTSIQIIGKVLGLFRQLS